MEESVIYLTLGRPLMLNPVNSFHVKRGGCLIQTLYSMIAATVRLLISMYVYRNNVSCCGLIMPGM